MTHATITEVAAPAAKELSAKCSWRRRTGVALVLAATAGLPPLRAQQTSVSPATDSSQQASPASSVANRGAATATDGSAQASPLQNHVHPGDPVPPRAVAVLHLDSTVSSATLVNGRHLHGKLTAPLSRDTGRPLPAGTPVELTVISVAPVGRIASYGEMTLEVTHVGTDAVFTLPQTFRGARGKRELPDSAPARGGEAVIGPGTTLRFPVQPPPVPASQLPRNPHIGTPQPVPQH